MIDTMIYDVVPRAGVIDLGKQIEGLVTRVVLPNIRRGAGTVQLVHQRSDDQEPYPVPITEDGESVYWLVSRTDTAFPGRGQAELQWLGENGAVAKSVTYQTNTTRSMAEPGPEPDEPLRPYTQAVAQSAQAAKDAAENATEAARSAEASAGQAGLSAATATEAAKNAEAIVGQAGQSAQSAQAAALAAAQNAAAAETAGEAAKQAQAGAEAARTEAQTAKTAAEKAAQEAKTAQTGAVEAKTEAETAQAKAEEAAQGIAADREQIGANTAGLAAAQQDVTALKAENSALKAETARTARSLDYLWKKSKGIIYDTETVTGAGSSVTVPSGAMDYAALRMVGGKTVVWNQIADDWERVVNSKILYFPKGQTITAGHKYFIAYDAVGAVENVVTQVIIYYKPEGKKPEQIGKTSSTGAGKKNGIVTAAKSGVSNLTDSITGSVWVYVYQPNGGVDNIKIIDLTIMFGSDNEPTDTSDPRIAPIVAYATAHPEYNAGELVSAVVDEVRIVNVAGDNTNTYPIPQAIRDLCPDYGQGTAESYNYVVFAAKAYYHVGRMSQDGTWTALAPPETIDLSAVWPDDFGILQVEAGGTIGLHYPALDDGFELAVPSETEIMVDVAKVVGTDG